MGDDPEISYSVKELLQQLNTRIDAFMTLISTKADQASVTHLAGKVDQLDGRVTTIEHESKATAKSSSARQEFRRWIVPTVLSLVVAGVMIWQAVRP